MNFNVSYIGECSSTSPFDSFVLDTAKALQNGELDASLVYRKRLRRRLDEYERNVPPHVQAARKLKTHVNLIRYVITRNGPGPVDAIKSELDYQHYQDKQLAPAADGILQFVDTSYRDITGAKMQMF